MFTQSGYATTDDGTYVDQYGDPLPVGNDGMPTDPPPDYGYDESSLPPGATGYDEDGYARDDDGNYYDEYGNMMELGNDGYPVEPPPDYASAMGPNGYNYMNNGTYQNSSVPVPNTMVGAPKIANAFKTLTKMPNTVATKVVSGM